MTAFRNRTFIISSAALLICTAHFSFGRDSREKVKVYRGQVDFPSYEFSGRELEPPLFANSTVEGRYPLPQFLRPYKPGGPQPASYEAISLENEYLRLTVVPDLGGRVFSLYDKVNRREIFYKNDVLKFSGVNAKAAWLVGNIELTGPYDTHMLTYRGEPFWFNRVLEHGDGSASVILSAIDPFYRMKVSFSARLLPGLSAIELTVFCYNRRDTRQPYMFWINAGLPATSGTRFIYPMTRTIGHTTAEVADWPYYNGIDFSWYKNNEHMLGVFGIDIYDNFLGAYDFESDYGTFRYADRREVTGMKTWTWGSSHRAERIEDGYTDKAGPYIEVQSGRHVWDGHYEWLPPHTREGWSEWWFPVAGTGGLTTATRDLALNLEVEADPQGKNSKIRVGLSANLRIAEAKITLHSGRGTLFETLAVLEPGKPFNRQIAKIAADSAGLAGLRLTVTAAGGDTLLDYHRPDSSPGGREYTNFTRQLEKPAKPPADMSVEELVLDAETKIKEMHAPAGAALLRLALERDSGCSRAHLNLGILHLEEGQRDSADAHLEQAVERDPYADEAGYYLALARLELGDTLAAERDLYYISRGGAFYSQREYLLGRLALLAGDSVGAERHLREAGLANGYNLSARALLALLYREQGRHDLALAQLEALEALDPTDRRAAAERYFISGKEPECQRLLELLGGQSQEALELAADYRSLGRLEQALALLALVEENNRDLYGTPAVFYYTKAACLQALGRTGEAAGYFKKGRAARENLDRFPFRPESIGPLAGAIIFDPADGTARYLLGCLLYGLGRKSEAIYHWERGVEVSPGDFSLQRSLGLAYYENGYGIEKAAGCLEAAIRLKPTHVRTFTDLSYLYSREGHFEEQLALLKTALERSPEDDNIIEGLIAANLVRGDYPRADSLIRSHTFAQRHRDYSLRDKYRFLHYGLGSRAFNSGKLEEALRQFHLALTPPSSLGADDFEFQGAPRLHYYIGRVLEQKGELKGATEAYRRGVAGWSQLSGDRDSRNSENFFMVSALERLGMQDQARELLAAMRNFAASQLENSRRENRAEAHYLLALVRKSEGNFTESDRLLREAVRLEPDLLGPRFELRGDVIDPLPGAE